MKKIGLVVLMLIVVLSIIGCSQTAIIESEPREENVEVEENEVETEEVIETESTEETTEELNFSDYTINDKQVKITHPNLEVDNVINILPMTTNEFIETFNFQDFEDNREKYGNNVGTIGGSYYFIVEETVFYLYFGAIQNSYDEPSVLTIESQYNSNNFLTIEVNGKEKINNTNYAEEVKKILGEPNSIGDSYDEYGEEILGKSLTYTIKGLDKATHSRTIEEDIILSILVDTETEKIISISLY